MTLTNKKGIFALSDIRIRQNTEYWPTRNDVWLNGVNWGTGISGTFPNTGYFGGGQVPGSTPIALVDRIDYSNDTATASPKGPLSSVRFYAAATGNGYYGYFGGGTPSGSSVDRIDYSNDTATASPKGPLSAARGYLAASSAAANGLPQ